VARTLAVWFQRSFGKQPNLKVGKIVPPPDTAEQDNIKERVMATRRAFLNAKEAKREKVREEARAHKANGLSERATVVEMNCGEGRVVRLLTEKFRRFRARMRRAA
jgi:hypothetical protein